jgi:hypothetical protein
MRQVRSPMADFLIDCFFNDQKNFFRLRALPKNSVLRLCAMPHSGVPTPHYAAYGGVKKNVLSATSVKFKSKIVMPTPQYVTPCYSGDSWICAMPSRGVLWLHAMPHSAELRLCAMWHSLESIHSQFSLQIRNHMQKYFSLLISDKVGLIHEKNFMNL